MYNSVKMILREIKTAFSSEVPIIDNEISNDISAPPGQPWVYENADIICCSVFYGDTVTALLREKNDDIEAYKLKLKEFLDKFPTMYAFNFSMEKGNFKGFLGKSYFIEEIKPFKGKGKSKQWFYEELIKDKKISVGLIPEDPLENDSKEVISLYEKGDYEKIINHNIVDVLKQYLIWKNKHYFLEKYRDNINKDGWYLR